MISDEAARTAKSVLIINVTRIGDTLLNTPAIRAIAAKFPNAAITCLGHAKRVEVLQHLPYLAHVDKIDKKTALWRGRIGVLTGKSYDWAFVWGDDAALHRYALRVAKHVVAYRQEDDALNAQFFHAAAAPALYSMHGVAMQLQLSRSVGIDTKNFKLDYVVTDIETRTAKQRLAKDAGGAKPLIGLQVASFPTKAYRDWPIEHFIELAKRIIGEYANAKFIMFGGSDDVARIAPFRDALPDHTVVYAGALTLRETVAVMKEIDLYIGVDTGPTHLYGALKKPMVAMYHSTLPSALYAPLQHPALYVVDHPLAGKVPVGAGGDAGGGTGVMADIGVDAVWPRVMDALMAKPSRYPAMLPVDIEGQLKG
jgi:heptosyltransferase III